MTDWSILLGSVSKKILHLRHWTGIGPNHLHTSLISDLWSRCKQSFLFSRCLNGPFTCTICSKKTLELVHWDCCSTFTFWFYISIGKNQNANLGLCFFSWCCLALRKADSTTQKGLSSALFHSPSYDWSNDWAFWLVKK